MISDQTYKLKRLSDRSKYTKDNNFREAIVINYFDSSLVGVYLQDQWWNANILFSCYFKALPRGPICRDTALPFNGLAIFPKARYNNCNSDGTTVIVYWPRSSLLRAELFLTSSNENITVIKNTKIKHFLSETLYISRGDDDILCSITDSEE